MRETLLAATVAPEDLCCGDYVAVLSVIREYPSCFWCHDSVRLPPEEPVRVRYCGADGGLPWKVKGVCLPFVFVKDPADRYRTLDTRMCQLARLPAGYAQDVWKHLSANKNEKTQTAGWCGSGVSAV